MSPCSCKQDRIEGVNSWGMGSAGGDTFRRLEQGLNGHLPVIKNYNYKAAVIHFLLVFCIREYDYMRVGG